MKRRNKRDRQISDLLIPLFPDGFPEALRAIVAENALSPDELDHLILSFLPKSEFPRERKD